MTAAPLANVARTDAVTHLANADDLSTHHAQQLRPRGRHGGLPASAASRIPRRCSLPEARRLVRPSALYGVSPFRTAPVPTRLRPAMTLQTESLR